MDATKIIMANKSFQALCTISWQKAAKLLATGEAFGMCDVIKSVHSQNMIVDVHEVIVLTSGRAYIDFSATMDSRKKATRTGVLRRDDYTCAYCGEYGTTIDHVLPKSRGGSSNWDNLVTACFKCNNVKDDNTPSEAGMELLFTPREPEMTQEMLQHELNILLSITVDS